MQYSFRFLLSPVLVLFCYAAPGLAQPVTQQAPPTAPGAAPPASSPTAHSDGRSRAGRPIVIAHRGASGYLPEHTLAAYTLALEQGADQIEPDLVLTRDGVLVAMHNLTLNHSTDIARHPEFADRARLDGNGDPVWHVYDFTLEELRTLRCRQGYRGRSHEFDGQETIPTFRQVVALVQSYNEEHDTRVGICLELKGPAAHGRAGLDLVAAFLESVATLELENDETMPVLVQCFEIGALETLRPETGLPLLLLLSRMPPEADWPRITAAADCIGIAKSAVLGEEGRANVAQIHGQGLAVIAWTFRNDSVAEGYADGAEEVYEAMANGIDGFFTDFPDTGVQARDQWFAAQDEATREDTPAPQD